MLTIRRVIQDFFLNILLNDNSPIFGKVMTIIYQWSRSTIKANAHKKIFFISQYTHVGIYFFIFLGLTYIDLAGQGYIWTFAAEWPLLQFLFP
jgi:hypothetical protein